MNIPMEIVNDNLIMETPKKLDGVSPALRATQEGNLDDELHQEYPGLTYQEWLWMARRDCLRLHKAKGYTYNENCEICGYMGWACSYHNTLPIDSDREHDLLIKSLEYIHSRHVDMKERKQHAGYELGAREFTLTYSPNWGMTDLQAQSAMRLAVERLIKYYSDEIIDFHAVGEFTKDGRAHIHGIYHLIGGLKITDKNFKRAYKYWNPKRKLGRGFEGGHHEVVKSVSDFKGYINKSDNTWFSTSVGSK